MWNPEISFSTISFGPPWHVTNDGKPHVMASITVNPKPSYNAGWTNAPRESAITRYNSPFKTLLNQSINSHSINP